MKQSSPFPMYNPQNISLNPLSTRSINDIHSVKFFINLVFKRKEPLLPISNYVGGTARVLNEDSQ